MNPPRSRTPEAAPPGSTAPTWILLTLVLAAMSAVGYFAFYKTGRGADPLTPPRVIPLTSPSSPAQATPTPAPVASPGRAVAPPED